MFAALMRKVGRWVGRLLGRRRHPAAARVAEPPPQPARATRAEAPPAGLPRAHARHAGQPSVRAAAGVLDARVTDVRQVLPVAGGATDGPDDMARPADAPRAAVGPPATGPAPEPMGTPMAADQSAQAHQPAPVEPPTRPAPTDRPAQLAPADRPGQLAPDQAAAPAAPAAPTRPVLPQGPAAVTVATDAETVTPLREAAQQAVVPRWLAAVRTRAFTGLAGLGLILFGGLTALVAGGLTAQADLAVTQAVQRVSFPLFAPLMLAVSAIGFPPQSFLLVAAVAVVLWLAGLRAETGFAIAAASSAVLTQTVKAFIARPRPGDDLVSVVTGATGYSFPSGHTLFYVTFFGFLGYAAYALLKPGRARTAAIWTTGLLILLVGPSRIWMGQHWASDVLASYALGLTYLVLLVQAYAGYRLGKQATVAASPKQRRPT